MLNFLGIGAQKCGTTWLCKHLESHPQVAFPAGKEIHFWDANYENGVGWYRSLFPKNNGLAQGEITPAYAMLPLEKIRELHDIYPELRLIYLLRNPLERAWSAALMALRNADMRIEEASDEWFIDVFKSQGSRLRSDYEMSVNNWLTVFDNEQLLIIDFNCIKEKPLTVLHEASKHIEVDSSFYDETFIPELQKKVYAGSNDGIRESLKPQLNEIYGKNLRYYNELIARL